MRLIRSAEFPARAESFLVSGVVAVLGLRAFLTATGFPKVGGGELHIAHLLWGGGLMLAGVLLLLAYLDRRVQQLAVVLAGLGFGTFIDEVGKFVTADNDYFFRPAIAIIYVVFVALFLAVRALAGSRALTQREALANAVLEVAGTIGRPIDEDDAARIRSLLATAGSSPPATDVERLLASLAAGQVGAAPGGDAPGEDAADAIAHVARDAYRRVVGSPWFERTVIAVVCLLAAAAIATGLLGLVGVGPTAGAGLGAPTVGQAVSSVVGAAFVLIGAALLPSKRPRAYHWFARGLLVWILVTQVFVFYASQLAGIGGLAIDLVAYATVRYAIRREAAAAFRVPAPLSST